MAIRQPDPFLTNCDPRWQQPFNSVWTTGPWWSIAARVKRIDCSGNYHLSLDPSEKGSGCTVRYIQIGTVTSCIWEKKKKTFSCFDFRLLFSNLILLASGSKTGRQSGGDTALTPSLSAEAVETRKWGILIFASWTEDSEECSGRARWQHAALIDRLHKYAGQSPVNVSQLPNLPPPCRTLCTFFFCTSYRFILFPASIGLPLAQASTLLLSCRLMIRALVCSSVSPSLSLIIPSFLLLSLTYPNSFPSILVPKPFKRHGTSTDINNKRTNGRQNDSFDDVKVKTVLTKGSNFDEDGMQVRRYHLSEQRLLVSAPQIGQGLQAKP